MNETPPPGSEKKPRRRSAPRKRAPAKAAAKAGKPRADTAEAGVDTTPPADHAERLDPTPLADMADVAGAQADDASTTQDAPILAPSATESAGPVPAAETDVDAAPAPDAATQAGGRKRGDRTTSADRGAGNDSRRNAPSVPADAPSPPERPAPSAPDATPPATIPRQASLRPGELIRVPLSVRWRDLDAFNHVNNSKYLSYLEEARLRWMLTVPGMGLDDDVAPVVAASNLNYKRPIGWPGEVVIELFVERLGTTSVTIGHRIVDASESGVTYCDGHVVMVWIDRTSGRAAPLPAAVREACARR